MVTLSTFLKTTSTRHFLKNVLIVTVCAEKRTDLERLIGWNVTPLRSASSALADLQTKWSHNHLANENDE